jgi:succinate-semialdehyde dehydrogenase/glutarate-semialdehyde dehydrogenase
MFEACQRLACLFLSAEFFILYFSKTRLAYSRHKQDKKNRRPTAEQYEPALPALEDIAMNAFYGRELADVAEFITDKDLLRSRCYIDGEWVAAGNGGVLPVFNPSSGKRIGSVPKLGAADARRAIEAAHAAFPSWRAKTAGERAAGLRRWHDLMLAAQEDLARLMTAEQGKPLAEARAEIAYAASFAEWFAEKAKRVYGDVIASPQADKRILVLKEPIGVCAAITPWNFPVAMITRKTAPALAAGCTVVLKPASATPFSALALADRAGIPRGVFNVVTGDATAIGTELATHSEAVAMANATAYGLAAYFYFRDVGRIFRVAEALEYGIIGVNTGMISTEVAPFGGMKESGIGREGGKYGIDEFREIKYLCMGSFSRNRL